LSCAYRRPAPVSGLRTSPCSPVQNHRHAVDISSTYRWRFHQHAASLLSPTSSSNVSQGRRQRMGVSGPASQQIDATSLGIDVVLYGDATRRLVLTLAQPTLDSCFCCDVLLPRFTLYLHVSIMYSISLISKAHVRCISLAISLTRLPSISRTAIHLHVSYPKRRAINVATWPSASVANHQLVTPPTRNVHHLTSLHLTSLLRCTSASALIQSPHNHVLLL
jgi:hypothetical protein